MNFPRSIFLYSTDAGRYTSFEEMGLYLTVVPNGIQVRHIFTPHIFSYAVLPSEILSCTFRKKAETFHRSPTLLRKSHLEPSQLLFLRLLVKQLFLRSRWFLNDDGHSYRESTVAPGVDDSSARIFRQTSLVSFVFSRRNSVSNTNIRLAR